MNKNTTYAIKRIVNDGVLYMSKKKKLVKIGQNRRWTHYSLLIKHFQNTSKVGGISR